jgi:ATP-dependent Clp protease ATP-binding subunit ClpX
MLSWWRGSRRRGGKLMCSFCGRSEDDVTNLVAGARAYICDACVDKCSTIIAAERNRRSTP